MSIEGLEGDEMGYLRVLEGAVPRLRVDLFGADRMR